MGEKLTCFLVQLRLQVHLGLNRCPDHCLVAAKQAVLVEGVHVLREELLATSDVDAEVNDGNVPDIRTLTKTPILSDQL